MERFDHRIAPGMGIRLGIAAGSVVLYAVSLAIPALEFTHETGGQEVMRGLEVALLGWQGLFVGNLAWLANLFLAVALLLLFLGLVRATAIVSALGTATALHTLAFLGTRVPVDEGGTAYMVVTHLHGGFALWLGSMSLLMIATCRWWWISRRSQS